MTPCAAASISCWPRRWTGLAAIKKISLGFLSACGSSACGTSTKPKPRSSSAFSANMLGRSSRTIALGLNADGNPGPQGRAWGPSTIHGNLVRRNGILNNELYIGRLIWNRQRFLKDPDTGKRIAKPNPPSAWILHEVPELRVLDDELWAAVKTLQTRASRATRPDCTGQQIWQTPRPK